MTVDQTPSLLQVRTTSTGDAAVSVHVTGELDVGNSGWLRGWIIDTVDRYRPAELRLDLGALHFVDVAGVRALYELQSVAEVRGCALVVDDAHPAVWVTLSRLGLDPEFVRCERPGAVTGR
ncbi:STAS domain-containing protein [Actinoplanes bogorensis]|uniref:STAS domain-containing protein n=1 Tax=Paractinoplanes bogorensis TaxID=1610840 RepID=A0ABS5YNT8_9ACTN|nr:STAS domain-containing protein [Actinoplanes bogorensis]MBU2665127.1 STAS domain-containing protein [Actinoplanes bogorensis]